MTKKLNDYNKIITVLNELHKLHPNYTLGKLISHAVDGEDIWGISDKELFYALEKHKLELEVYTNSTSERELEDIIKQGMDLNHILDEEEEE